MITSAVTEHKLGKGKKGLSIAAVDANTQKDLKNHVFALFLGRKEELRLAIEAVKLVVAKVALLKTTPIGVKIQNICLDTVTQIEDNWIMKMRGSIARMVVAENA